MLDLTVAERRDLTPVIRSLVLREHDYGTLPGFAAGAHISVAVRLRDGRLSQRAYSLAAPANGQSFEIAVQCEEGGDGGSAYVYGLAVGDRVRADLPRNGFELAPAPSRSVLVAGGIGITPILCMARALDRARRPYAFHYVARAPESMAYADEARGLGAELVYDGGDPEL